MRSFLGLFWLTLLASTIVHLADSWKVSRGREQWRELLNQEKSEQEKRERVYLEPNESESLRRGSERGKRETHANDEFHRKIRVQVKLEPNVYENSREKSEQETFQSERVEERQKSERVKRDPLNIDRMQEQEDCVGRARQQRQQEERELVERQKSERDGEEKQGSDKERKKLEREEKRKLEECERLARHEQKEKERMGSRWTTDY